MRTGVRDFGVTIGGKAGKVVLGLLIQGILAWNLGAADRGSLAICVVFATFLATIFSLGTDMAVIYFVSSRRFSLSEGVIHTLIYGLSASAAAVGAGWLAIRLPLAFFQQASPGEFRLALLLVPVSIIGVALIGLFTAAHRFKDYTLVYVSQSVVYLILIILLVWIIKGGVQGALWALILSNALMAASALLTLWRKCRLEWVRPRWSRMAAMLKYGVRHYPAKVSYMLNWQAGPMVLSFFATRAEIGWFAIAVRITQLIEMIPDATTAVLLPRSAGHQEGRSRLVARAARVIGIICGAILAGLVVFAPPLVRIVFSPEFLPAVSFIRILAIGLIVRCLSKVMVAYLMGTDRPGIDALAVSAGVVANLAALWYLLPRFGVIGAPWGLTVSYLVSSAIILTSFRRLSGLTWGEILIFRKSDWKELGKLVKLVGRPPARERG